MLLKKKDIVIDVGRFVMAEMSNTKQVKGDHYKTMTMQPWDFIIENQLIGLLGEIFVTY